MITIIRGPWTSSITFLTGLKNTLCSTKCGELFERKIWQSIDQYFCWAITSKYFSAFEIIEVTKLLRERWVLPNKLFFDFLKNTFCQKHYKHKSLSAKFVNIIINFLRWSTKTPFLSILGPLKMNTRLHGPSTHFENSLNRLNKN